MSNDVKQNLTKPKTWTRIFFVVVFALIFSATSWLVAVVTLMQVGWALVSGRPNERIQAFGSNLGAYLKQVVAFMTYDSDFKPFPFADWPGAAKLPPHWPEGQNS